MKSKLVKLQSLRGFAALYVALFHSLPQQILIGGINIGILFRFGSEAVVLFFFLSGFVIKYSFEKSTDKSFKNFFLKRFLRIYIPLVFIFLIGYIYMCMVHHSLVPPEIGKLIGNLLMFQDISNCKPNVICSVYMANGPLWSLSYEWWFYVLFYFITTKVKEENRDKFIAAITIISAVSYFFYPFALNRLIIYLLIWWVGTKMAELYLRKEVFTFRKFRNYYIYISIILVVMGANFYYYRHLMKLAQYPYSSYPFIEFRHYVFTIVILTVGLLWYKAKFVMFDYIFGPFKYIASCSYAIYISHFYFTSEATYLRFLNNELLEKFLYFVVLIAFSFFLEIFVYQKIMDRLYSIDFFSRHLKARKSPSEMMVGQVAV